jgi:transcriptional regulator with XRE-family HTH domain
MEINYKIGNFLTYLRQEKSLTQKELALIINVSDKAVSKWENGRCLPSLSNIKHLAEIYNITEDEILNGEKNETKPEHLKFNQQLMQNMKRQLLINYIIFGVYYFIFIIFIISASLNVFYHVPNVTIGMPSTITFAIVSIILILTYLIKLLFKRRLQDLYELLIILIPIIITIFFTLLQLA